MTCIFCGHSPLRVGGYTDVVIGVDAIEEVTVELLSCPCCGEQVEGKQNATGRTWPITTLDVTFDPWSGRALVDGKTLDEAAHA